MNATIAILSGMCLTFFILLLRANRRLSEEVILRLLREKPDYGLGLLDRANGLLRQGSLYVVLHDLEGQGEIESWEEPRDDPRITLPRRMYRISDEMGP